MNAFQKLIIYYFAGTGNSKNVALWLSKAATEKNIDTQLINIGDVDKIHIEKPDPNALIAFISPVHGFNYSPIMINFILRFPKGVNKVLLLNTRAGMLIGKFITSGISGITFYLSALIFWLKGYSIKAMYPVDLPSNWISLHLGLNEKTVAFLHEKNKERVNRFAYNIFLGRCNFRSLFEIVQDVLVAPISLAYFFIGRFVIAKTFFASRDCNKCDICINTCKVKAIIKIDDRPYWTYNCESCMQCMNYCPMRAIETAHGLFVFLCILYSLIITPVFYKCFSIFFFEVKNVFAQFFVETLLLFGLFALTYRLMHYALRIKIIERMMVYTSLTKLKLWR